jgi:ADP-heptose:LPS heptosyltransferase
MIRKIRARLNLRRRLRRIGDWLIAHIPQKKQYSNAVLIIRLDAIGDFILWLDSAKEIRKLYPEKKIVLCANAAWAGLAERLTYWDGVIAVERNRLLDDLIYRFKLFINIRKQHFQIAIQPTFSREYLFGDSVIRLTGAMQRIGSQGHLNPSYKNEQDKAESDTWYTKLISADNATLMELKRNAEFIRGLGAKDFAISVPKIEKLLDLPLCLQIEKPYYVIFPGAGWNSRMWSSAKYAELITRLHNSLGWQAVLCGSFHEETICDEIIELSGCTAINLAGKTSLIELVEVVRSAKLLIGNETSAIHIAAATSTPSVCILGGGHFGRFMPYDLDNKSNAILPIVVFNKMDCFGCNWGCIYPAKPDEPCPPCITGIEVDQVEKACIKAISKA